MPVDSFRVALPKSQHKAFLSAPYAVPGMSCES